MHAIDDTDIKILNLLQQNARISERQLAIKVFRSPPNVHKRVMRLEENGFIKNYVTLLDRDLIGIPLMAQTHVKLEKQNHEALIEFEQRINRIPQIQFCCHLAGKWDFVLFIAMKNPQAYNDWLMNDLTRWPIVKNIESSFVLKEIKTYAAFDL